MVGFMSPFQFSLVWNCKMKHEMQQIAYAMGPYDVGDEATTCVGMTTVCYDGAMGQTLCGTLLHCTSRVHTTLFLEEFFCNMSCGFALMLIFSPYPLGCISVHEFLAMLCCV